MEISTKQFSVGQLEAICKRAFGNGAQILSAEELGGGTFNSTYRITLADELKIILRVAPPHTTDTYWDEAFLMRREHTMQPYFAPVAALMPKTLFVDFTHQLIDCDYMFQSFIDGERWDDVVDELSAAENDALWKQFGEITRQIHGVHGEAFGISLPGFQFPTWSQTVMNRFERTLQAAHERKLEIPRLGSIVELVRAYPQRLDEIEVPCLLHGDLWLFNILIQRNAGEPNIVGILDADRSWWGDPMADWTMFVLKHAEKESGHVRFWKAYGQLEETRGVQYRTTVYDAMHAATAFIWATQHNDEGTVTRAQGTLSEVADALPDLIS